MSGFPTRITANALGPRMKNRGAPRDPERDVSAERMNLMRWQIAGLSQAAPVAWLFASFTPPDTVKLAAQGNAWQGLPPTFERIAPGNYLVTYASTVKDADDVDVVMNLLAAAVSPRAGTPHLFGDWEIANGREVTVRLFDKNDLDADGSFFLQVF